MGHADITITMIYAHFYSDGHDLIERACIGRGIDKLTANSLLPHPTRRPRQSNSPSYREK